MTNFGELPIDSTQHNRRVPVTRDSDNYMLSHGLDGVITKKMRYRFLTMMCGVTELTHRAISTALAVPVSEARDLRRDRPISALVISTVYPKTQTISVPVDPFQSFSIPVSRSQSLTVRAKCEQNRRSPCHCGG